MVALLLLAAATIGAGTAMVHSVAGQRAALLRTRAADLAADLAEALRSAPDAATREAEVRAWRQAVEHQLPQVHSEALPRAGSGPAPRPAGFDIRLQWRDGRMPAPTHLALSLSLGPAEWF
jgi:hypothetical protein